MFLVSIGLSSTLSFLSLKVHSCLASAHPRDRLIAHQADLSVTRPWDFPGLFQEIFVTIFREVSGQFSGRHSGTPNTTNKGLDYFPTIYLLTFPRRFSGRPSRERFPEHFRTNFQASSGPISGRFSGSSSKPDQGPSRQLEQSQAKGCCRNAIYPHKPKFRNTLLYLQKPTTV